MCRSALSYGSSSGLNEKCPPEVHVFEHLALSCWHCLGRLCKLGWEVLLVAAHHSGLALRAYRLTELPIYRLHFLHAWTMRIISFLLLLTTAAACSFACLPWWTPW